MIEEEKNQTAIPGAKSSGYFNLSLTSVLRNGIISPNVFKESSRKNV